jgi:hypothetical protein
VSLCLVPPPSPSTQHSEAEVAQLCEQACCCSANFFPCKLFLTFSSVLACLPQIHRGYPPVAPGGGGAWRMGPNILLYIINPLPYVSHPNFIPTFTMLQVDCPGVVLFSFFPRGSHNKVLYENCV